MIKTTVVQSTEKKFPHRHREYLQVFYINPLTAGPEYIWFFFLITTLSTTFWNILGIKCEQQDLKIVHLHFVKSA